MKLYPDQFGQMVGQMAECSFTTQVVLGSGPVAVTWIVSFLKKREHFF